MMSTLPTAFTHTKKKRTEGHVNALGTNSIACESFEALLLQSIIIKKKKKIPQVKGSKLYAKRRYYNDGLLKG